MSIRDILSAEGLTKEAASASISVSVTDEGTWPDGTPWKDVQLRGGGSSISGRLYKRGRSVGWASDDDDDAEYRDEFLSQVIGASVFK